MESRVLVGGRVSREEEHHVSIIYKNFKFPILSYDSNIKYNLLIYIDMIYMHIIKLKYTRD